MGAVKAITTQSGVAYDGPTILPNHSPPSKVVKRETEVTKDKVQTTNPESTAHVQPPVVQVPTPKPVVAPKPIPKPSIPYPSRLNDQKLREKTNSQMLKFLQIFQRLNFDLSFADALLYIPKFASTFKSLLSNKEKLFELANTPLTENCSADLLKKLPEKLGDPRRFLIPCDFQGLESCMALADLGASMKLMPLYVCKKLYLPDLTPSHMTLVLATRSYAYPAGIAEDVFMQVGKFTFQVDFVFVDYDVNPRVRLILGRPFEDGPLTPFETSDSLLEEFADELAILDPFPLRKEDNNFDFEADLREIEYLLNQDPSNKNDEDDDLFDLKSDNNECKKILYGDRYKDIDSEKDKNKNSKMKSLVVEESSESSEIASLSSSPFENEDKVFNPGILILERTQIFNDKDYKVNTSSEALLILKERNFPSISSDKDLLFFLKLTMIETLLSFSSKNNDKVFNPRILTSKEVHYLTLELSHRTYETFKIINIYPNIFNGGLMKIFPSFVSAPKDKRIREIPYGSIKVHIEVLSVLWGNRLSIPDSSLPLSSKTAKDLWDALERQMRDFEYAEQDRKAAILYEYETFKATEGEQLLDMYLRYLQLINDLKKCGYNKDNYELNYKFLNNLQLEWKQYGTLMRQTKNLMDINIDALYNILKKNQGDVNDALGYKKKTVVVTSDPLALVAKKTKVSKHKEKVKVQSESEESDDEDISDLKKITALLAKAFNRKKYYAKPTNNNLRTYLTSSSANKKPDYVKSVEKKEDKKADEKKRDMSKVKCYNCKKEGHFANDCKKAK
nr:reverse transcriptase domain-containing protein [Tanacetum cinerariifolium]